MVCLQEFSPLAIDNSSRINIMSQPADKEQCKNDGWKLVVNGAGAPFKNQGQCVKFVNTGNGASPTADSCWFTISAAATAVVEKPQR